MKVVLPILLGIMILPIGFSSPSFAVDNYEFRGNGISLDADLEIPTLYKSSLWLTFNSLSEITKGSVILKSDDGILAARMIIDEWNLSYNADGSFVASGPLYTLQNNQYEMKITGERKFVATNWSMWEAVGEIEGNNEHYSLQMIITGDDRFAKTSSDILQRIAIPAGNAKQHETGSYIPESPTVFRGTTVIWMNHDGVEHTVQSQDGKGNIISGFNSDVLKPGETFSHKFYTPGIYDYLCSLHPWRTGTISVV